MPRNATITMKPTKSDVARQFDRMSRAYASSTTHAGGDDLEALVRYVEPSAAMRVLDVATGSGNTAAAIAPHVREVIACDIAAAMLERTRELAAVRGLRNVAAVHADVEALPFDDGSFDVVTCRIAPHHFIDIDRALSEVARVLRAGGAFVVEDSIVPEEPELDRFLNELEAIRDPTHVRSLTQAEWDVKLRSAGLVPVRSSVWPKAHDVAEWIARAGAQPEAVYAAFAAAPPAAVDRFCITVVDGRAVRYSDEKVLIRAEKPAENAPLTSN